MLSQDELLSHPAIAVHCNSTLDYFVNQEGVKPITADPSSFPTEGGLIAALIPSIQVYQVHFFALPKFEAGQLSLEQVTRKIGKETLTRAYSFPVSEHMVTRLNQDVLAPFEYISAPEPQQFEVYAEMANGSMDPAGQRRSLVYSIAKDSPLWNSFYNKLRAQMPQ